ncbi:serine protease [Myxococcaceae bacterium GXIMD 01537]
MSAQRSLKSRPASLRTVFVLGILSLTTGSLTGCGASGDVPSATDESLETREDKAIVGNDDRTDVYAHPDATLRDLAMHSTPVLWKGVTAVPSAADVSYPTLTMAENLCPTERFRNDPIIASCSGVLIDNDLVLTAGHCIDASLGCSYWKWVFNYYRTSDTTMAPITADDVFTCSQIVLRTQTTDVDYAIVRLDRPATPRFTPARIAYGRNAFVPGHPVAMIGSSDRTPLKIDAAGQLAWPDTDNPWTSLDTFPANSGSAVYSREGYTVTGVVFAAIAPYYESNGTCNVARTTTSRGAMFYAMRPILETLCATGFSSQRLCFNIKGTIEGSSPTGDIVGWAFDNRPDPSVSLALIVVFDGVLWNGTGTVVSATGNILRTDVNQYYGITGGHGFSIPVPAQFRDGQNHTVRVYAIDSAPLGPVEELSNSPWTFSISP